eukprot:scaffold53_cov193-Pinguiococcus_pyrenoidosus.AAC.69
MLARSVVLSQRLYGRVARRSLARFRPVAPRGPPTPPPRALLPSANDKDAPPGGWKFPSFEHIKALPNGWTPPPKEPPKDHPFHVDRTKTGGHLPVYSRLRNDNTKILTRIRKVRGDVHALAKLVREACGGTDTWVHSNGHTIYVHGDYVRHVKLFLTSLGF